MPSLPPRPDLDQLRRQAKERVRLAHEPTLHAAHLRIARDHGFSSWPKLVAEIHRRTALDDGPDALRRLVERHPELATTEMLNWLDHPFGATPLGYVAMLRYDTAAGLWRDVPGTAEAARILIGAGAPIEGLPSDRETPLITAASYGDAAFAAVLVEMGADLEATARPDSGGIPGATALVHAAVFGMTEVVDLLVEVGARVGSIEIAAAAGDLSGWMRDSTTLQEQVRSLVMAADHERLGVIDRLVDAGTPIDAIDETFGRHPLRISAGNGRVASVKRLLKLGADPNLADPTSGLTPLRACREGRMRVMVTARHDEVERLLVASGSIR